MARSQCPKNHNDTVIFMKTIYKEMSLDVERGAYATRRIRRFHTLKTQAYYKRRQIGAILVLLFPLVIALFVSASGHADSTWDACYKEIKQECHKDAECMEGSSERCSPSLHSGHEPLPSVAARGQ